MQRAPEFAGSDGRREEMRRQYDDARRACVATNAALRMALHDAAGDLAQLADLAEQAAINAGRLAGFARRLKGLT